MNWIKIGQGIYIVIACLGAAGGAVAASSPTHAALGGMIAAVCFAVDGVLGGYLPSMSEKVNREAAKRALANQVVK
jgi:hypothetical protein